ncbi:hypothetical protein ACFS07_00435 [Undibacterium arcticum]
MALVGTFGVVLLVLTTLIHYEVLRMLAVGLPTLNMAARAKLIVVIFAAFFAHVAEIFLYAVAFYVLVLYFDAGPLGQASSSSLTLCMYFFWGKRTRPSDTGTSFPKESCDYSLAWRVSTVSC